MNGTFEVATGRYYKDFKGKDCEIILSCSYQKELDADGDQFVKVVCRVTHNSTIFSTCFYDFFNNRDYNETVIRAYNWEINKGGK
ncbi:hypothetical protein ABT56_19175 [Photobacterium aquae]|uniref:Uncharacterized protein n=1 Tax=Photobacterium aquae TaxID=1195763 RepID=A0A0J1GVA1_9GAMM|nr:hypothetical protein ABT56_19175 [Photobacterium aquae]